MTIRESLTREQVRSVIEFKGCEHVPTMHHFWVNPRREAPAEWNERVSDIRNRYPEDVLVLGLRGPALWDAPAEAPRQRWAFRDKPSDAGIVRGLDSGQKIIADLATDIDAFLADFPDPNYAPYYEGVAKTLAGDQGRLYRLACSFFCFFERMWSIMGMEETLINFHTCPEAMHRLLRALCDFHKHSIRNAAALGRLDGWLTSDDIGQQTGPFFSVAFFNEFFKPYYKELIDECHSHNMHFWLHTCGNIEAFLPGLVEIGLDVIHPIQKYTMDERKIARDWGGRICFWAGFDVQRILPYGTPDDVRREVQFMIDTYGRPDGGLMLTAGNGVTPDCPPENIEAFFDESVRYGANYASRH